MKNMEKFKAWEIWLATVKFEDINQSKVRPIIILETSKNTIKSLKLTSKEPRFKKDYSLKFWKESGLKKPTTAKTEKFIVLNFEKTIFKIGEIQVFDKFCIEKLILGETD